MAKAGTSSIFETLVEHPDVDYRGIKENFNFSHRGQSINDYVEYYKKYNVSMNFCPSLWTMETRQIKEISKVVTHYSIIFRNPFEFATSWYNFLPVINKDFNSFIEMMIEFNYLDYAKILTHWDSIANTKPFKIMFFDDLKMGSEFYNSLTEFLNLQPFDYDVKITNITSRKRPNTVLSDKTIKTVNSLIDKFEQQINKDLTHWKSDV